MARGSSSQVRALVRRRLCPCTKDATPLPVSGGQGGRAADDATDKGGAGARTGRSADVVAEPAGPGEVGEAAAAKMGFADFKECMHKVRWFQSLSDNDLDRLVKRCRRTRYTRYSTIIREGNFGASFYLLLRGKVPAYRSRRRRRRKHGRCAHCRRLRLRRRCHLIPTTNPHHPSPHSSRMQRADERDPACVTHVTHARQVSVTRHALHTLHMRGR